MAYISNIIIEHWQQPKIWGWILWPMSLIFALIVKIRRWLYMHRIFNSYKAKVPVIIVGNITVGGTGKTQLVLYLAELLRKQGYKPGIVTRGYKGTVKTPSYVLPNIDPKLVGDEAILLAKRSLCPVIVAKKRPLGVQKLSIDHNVDIVISDDGLQHYALARDIEIALIDGQRGFGNGYSLPMGPLREPVSRLKGVDLTVINGKDFTVVCDKVYALLDATHAVDLKSFAGQKVHAVAGIGNPDQFFNLLRTYNIEVVPHAFPDHHPFKECDLNFKDELPILMTEKDAVKCRYFARSEHWVVAVQAVVADSINEKILQLVTKVNHGRCKLT